VKGSGIYRILFQGVLVEVYCDMDSYGGGWTLVYSSTDDSTGDNNMQQV
jgi:hypothetical protein